MPSDSPRRPGSIPAERSTRSASAADPAQPASAARSVLRRWENAASMTANTAARDAPSRAGPASRTVKATRPESTRGTGQNALRGTEPARRTSAYQASLADGMP
jgi:hypothetical protein